MTLEGSLLELATSCRPSGLQQTALLPAAAAVASFFWPVCPSRWYMSLHPDAVQTLRPAFSHTIAMALPSAVHRTDSTTPLLWPVCTHSAKDKVLSLCWERSFPMA